VENVQNIVGLSKNELFSLEGRQTFVQGDEAIAVVPLSHLLEMETRPVASTAKQPCVILSAGVEKVAVLVDSLLDEQEVVLKPLGPVLKRVRNVAGSTILGTGEVCMILNAHDLIRSALKRGAPSLPAPETSSETPEGSARRKVILLAEDSITTRTQEKRILESAGYEVVTAVDGADAFSKLSTRDFDAVVSDVEMPNLDGLSLAARIREDKRYEELPIVLVTSLASDDDKRRGVEVGASAYITKGTFEQKVLLDTLERLV
jgi:two-component system chemotaxis sensor kinase CheA